MNFALNLFNILLEPESKFLHNFLQKDFNRFLINQFVVLKIMCMETQLIVTEYIVFLFLESGLCFLPEISKSLVNRGETFV